MGTHQPLAGVTVVATHGGSDAVAISDDTGAYDLEVAPATLTLTYYYNDTSLEQTVSVVECAGEVDLGTFAMSGAAGHRLRVLLGARRADDRHPDRVRDGLHRHVADPAHAR